MKPGLRKGDLRQLLRLVTAEQAGWRDRIENCSTERVLRGGKWQTVALSAETIERKAPYAVWAKKKLAEVDELVRRINVELET